VCLGLLSWWRRCSSLAEGCQFMYVFRFTVHTSHDDVPLKVNTSSCVHVKKFTYLAENNQTEGHDDHTNEISFSSLVSLSLRR
jgi:hypothetical protein